MAHRSKYGTGIVELKPLVAWENGRQVTSRVWEGPYDTLAAKLEAEKAGYQTMRLSPTTAGQGRLEASNPETPGESSGGSETVLEVEWVELTRSLHDHPKFVMLSEKDHSLVDEAIAERSASIVEGADDPATARALYRRLVKGQTDYTISVPVCRRTTPASLSQKSGGAWFLDDPPAAIKVDGWTYMKTSDRITRTGQARSRVEEWTGAKSWDDVVYGEAEPSSEA